MTSTLPLYTFDVVKFLHTKSDAQKQVSKVSFSALLLVYVLSVVAVRLTLWGSRRLLRREFTKESLPLLYKTKTLSEELTVYLKDIHSFFSTQKRAFSPFLSVMTWHISKKISRCEDISRTIKNKLSVLESVPEAYAETSLRSIGVDEHMHTRNNNYAYLV